MYRKQLKRIAFGIALTCSLNIAKPARAVDPGQLFTGVGRSLGIGDLLEQLGISNVYFEQFLSDVLGIHSTKTKSKIEEDMKCDDCALDLPDLTRAESKISKTLESSGELNKLEVTTSRIEAKVVRAHADSILSKEGQQKIVENAEAVEGWVGNSIKYGRDAQGRKVTQEAIKDLNLQISELSMIMGANQQSIEKLNVSTAYNNRVNAELLEKQINQQEKAKDENTEALLTEAKALIILEDLFLGGAVEKKEESKNTEDTSEPKEVVVGKKE